MLLTPSGSLLKLLAGQGLTQEPPKQEVTQQVTTPVEVKEAISLPPKTEESNPPPPVGPVSSARRNVAKSEYVVRVLQEDPNLTTLPATKLAGILLERFNVELTPQQINRVKQKMGTTSS